MRVFIFTAYRGLGELPIIQGFRKLLGKDKVNVFTEKLSSAITSKEMLENYDLILMFRDVVEGLKTRSLVATLLNSSINFSTSISICDVFDDPLINRIALDRRVLAYFKREYVSTFFDPNTFYKFMLSHMNLSRNPCQYLTYQELIKAHNSSRLVPLPLTYIDNEKFVPSRSKKYTVSFIANIPKSPGLRHKLSVIPTWRVRYKLAELIKRVPNSYVALNIGHKGGIPRKRYLSIISESLGSLSVIGMGFDTARYWEIPYAGSVLIAEKPRTLIPNNLVHGEHAFFYRSINDLMVFIEYLIENEETAIEMGRKAREFVMKYHSPKARAKYILNMIKAIKE